MATEFENQISERILGRRDFLKIASASVVIGPSIMAPEAFGQGADFSSLPRTLWLQRPASGEMIKEVYWYDGKLHEPGYKAICALLRDVKVGQAVDMDLRLLDILRGVQGWLEAFGINQPLITTSGYRTYSTNARTEGAVQNSKHPLGRAWDGKIHGVSTAQLAKFGEYLSGGGVGFYQAKDFVHLDSGRLRSWRS